MKRILFLIVLVGLALAPLAAQQPVDVCDEQYGWCREGCITLQCIYECKEYRMECVTGVDCQTTTAGVIICPENQGL